MKVKHQPHYLYIVDCGFNHFYIGITYSPTRRELQHKGSLKGAAYFTKRHGFKTFKILAWFQNKQNAKEAETKLVRLMRNKYKDLVIAGAREGHLE